MGSSKKLTIGFIVLALIVCLLYTLWGQSNTAGSIYDAVVGYEGMDVLLGSDADFTKPQLEADIALENAGDDFASQNPGTAKTVSTDGAEIACMFYDLGGDTTAVLLHGYWRQGEDMLKYAPFWAEKGFNVLTVDMRGFGSSTGETTLGYIEAEDIKSVVSEICPEDRLIFHGHGMGADTAILCAELENTVLVVAEEAFTDLEDYTAEFCKRQFSLPRFSVIWCTNNVLKKNAGFAMADYNALEAVQNTDTPIVFITGANSEFVPAAMTEKLYEACSSAGKKRLVVENAGYGESYAADTPAYENVINDALASLY